MQEEGGCQHACECACVIYGVSDGVDPRSLMCCVSVQCGFAHACGSVRTRAYAGDLLLRHDDPTPPRLSLKRGGFPQSECSREQRGCSCCRTVTSNYTVPVLVYKPR